MDTELLPFLYSVGLSELQARVYLAALELGESNIQELARKAKVKRTSIYNFLDELKERQFVVETPKGKRSVYSATGPDRLLEMAKRNLAVAEKSLPGLLAIHNKSGIKPRVRFYEGLEGIREVYQDTLKEGQTIFGWSDFESMKGALGKYYNEYPSQRAAKGIIFKTIARDTAAARALTKMDASVLRQKKYIKSGELNTEINVYGDKVAFMSFRSDTPLAILIEDHNIAETLKTVWGQLWAKLR